LSLAISKFRNLSPKLFLSPRLSLDFWTFFSWSKSLRKNFSLSPSQGFLFYTIVRRTYKFFVSGSLLSVFLLYFPRILFVKLPASFCLSNATSWWKLWRKVLSCVFGFTLFRNTLTPFLWALISSRSALWGTRLTFRCILGVVFVGRTQKTLILLFGSSPSHGLGLGSWNFQSKNVRQVEISAGVVLRARDPERPFCF